MAEVRIDRRDCQGGDLRSICRRQARSPQASCPHRPRLVLRAEVQGFPVTDDLEPFECIYFRIQATRSYSAIQGNSEAGRVPGAAVLTVILANVGGAGRAATRH